MAEARGVVDCCATAAVLRQDTSPTGLSECEQLKCCEGTGQKKNYSPTVDMSEDHSYARWSLAAKSAVWEVISTRNTGDHQKHEKRKLALSPDFSHCDFGQSRVTLKIYFLL